MLWDAKSGLTEAVVMGPGQAILFYGMQSLGEGLCLGEAWDAMFMLSEGISWVGKQAQLNPNALSLWEGQQLIVKVITKWHAEARGPGCPHSCLPALPPFRFHNQDRPLQEERLQSTDECVEDPRCTCLMSHHDWDWYHNVAGAVARCNETHGLHWPQHLQLYQIVGLRVIEVQCQLPSQCHQGLQAYAPWLATQGARRSYENQSPSLQGWRQEGCHHLSKLALGLNGVLPHWVPRPHPPPLCYLLPTGLSWGVGKKFRDRCHFRWLIHCTGWTLQHCQGPRCL